MVLVVLARPIVTGATVGAVLSAASISGAQTLPQGNDRSGDPDIPTGMAYPEPHCYVDSAAGNDSASGQSEAEPWASLSPARSCGTVYLKKGSTFASLSARGQTISTYGTGDRPVIQSSVSLSGTTMLEGVKVDGSGRIGIMISGSGNVVSNCEIDGRSGSFELGFGVMGAGNLIIGNSVHHLSAQSGDSGDMNTSGGAEAYMIMGSNNEIAYNSASEAHGINETLGGEEGGCLEIVNGQAGSVIEDVYFHHNYCERSIGLWEGCSGNFQGTDKIQENHGIIRNVVLAYNLSVDAMWLYLIQPVNTDFDNVVFEHNTLIHTPANDSDFTQAARNSFGLQVTEDQGYTGTISPGNIIVRNNLFWVTNSSGGGTGFGAGGAMMQLPPDGDHYNNIYAGWSPSGTLGTGEIQIDDPGLSETFRLLEGSPAIDAGAAQAWQVWNDYDGNAVPLAAGRDIGAFEFCAGADCNTPSETPAEATGGAGGAPGDTTTGGSTPAAGGSTPGAGGAAPVAGTTPAAGGVPPSNPDEPLVGAGGTQVPATPGAGGTVTVTPAGAGGGATSPTTTGIAGASTTPAGSGAATPPTPGNGDQSSAPSGTSVVPGGTATPAEPDTSDPSGAAQGSASGSSGPSDTGPSDTGPSDTGNGVSGTPGGAAPGSSTEGVTADSNPGVEETSYVLPLDPNDDSGCGCRVTSSRTGNGGVPWRSPAGLLGAALLTLLGRRRAQRRAPSLAK